MKISPSNQSLILANERLPASKAAQSLISRAGGGGTGSLQLTVISARADEAVLVLPADNAAPRWVTAQADDGSAFEPPIAPDPDPSVASRALEFGSSAVATHFPAAAEARPTTARSMLFLSPTEQYARNQASSAVIPRIGRLDVRA